VHPPLGSIGLIYSPDIEVARLSFHLLYQDIQSRREILYQFADFYKDEALPNHGCGFKRA
jgi:hypothetical protein